MSHAHISVDNQIGPVGAVVSGVDLSQPLARGYSRDPQRMVAASCIVFPRSGFIAYCSSTLCQLLWRAWISTVLCSQ